MESRNGDKKSLVNFSIFMRFEVLHEPQKAARDRAQ